MSIDPHEFSGAVEDLISATDRLNEVVAIVRAFGLQVSISVNGIEYGDRVGVRIEGDLVDAYARPEAAA